MRTLRLTLAGTVSITLLAGAAGSTAAQDLAPEVSDPASVLFVGNSLTYWNGGVEQHVAALADAEDPARALIVDAWTPSDATLKSHYRKSELLDRGALQEIRGGGHDVVVLQGYITGNHEREVAPFLEYARLFDAEIKDADARTVFYMAWPYEQVDWIDLDGIIEAHRQLEAELGADIAPVGLAMANARAERPDLAMLDSDELHPSPAGTYLASATIYATLFDRSPEGLPFSLKDVDPEDAAFLQRIAWQTVQEWREGASPAE